ncbi:glycosyltransferase family 9 protein [Pedobacter sp. SD-b]|uniref:Glycosyltransferase family 9 protein n=2 Tax=Pedobacter segetis TaxID=2793069 RepID=A0ABS1BMH5_9SPHI|nr:glycosyltransferase family 9 protein [Pedobacter segetis]
MATRPVGIIGFIRFFISVKKNIKKKYDFAIDFRGDLRNFLVLNIIKANHKISQIFFGGEYLLTFAIKPNNDLIHFHEESLYFLEKMGCEYIGDNYPRLDREVAVELCSNFLLENKIDPSKTIIGVHPGASQDVKKWDEDKYILLIKYLDHRFKGLHFLIFQGPSEEETIEKIEKGIFDIDYTIVNRPLSEYVKLISLCEALVCNDSGAGHIAAAYAIPLVVIFGNVNPDFVYPKGSVDLRIISNNLDCKPCFSSTCRFKTNECIKGVAFKVVAEKAADVISNFYFVKDDK